MMVSRRVWIMASVVLSALVVGGYVVVYQLEPFSPIVNDTLLNLFTILAASFAVGTAALILSLHTKQDQPYPIWLSFTFGFVAWVLAEIFWSVYNIFVAQVPTPGPADLMWYLGYVFFTMGFVRQYRVTYQSSRRVELAIVAAVWALVLGLSLVFTVWINDSAFVLSAFVDISYPFADLAMVVFALGLVWAFRGGAFARPWFGMVVFSLSDGLYAWLVQTGAYAWSIKTGNPVSLFVDVVYVLAYLMVGFGFLSQYLLLRYGPRIRVAAVDDF